MTTFPLCCTPLGASDSRRSIALDGGPGRFKGFAGFGAITKVIEQVSLEKKRADEVLRRKRQAEEKLRRVAEATGASLEKLKEEAMESSRRQGRGGAPPRRAVRDSRLYGQMRD